MLIQNLKANVLNEAVNSLRYVSLNLFWTDSSASVKDRQSTCLLRHSLFVVADQKPAGVFQLCRLIRARHIVTDSHANQLVVLTSAHVANDVQLNLSGQKLHLWTLILRHVHQFIPTVTTVPLRFVTNSHSVTAYIDQKLFLSDTSSRMQQQERQAEPFWS